MYNKIVSFSKVMTAVSFLVVLLVLSTVSIAGSKIVPVAGMNFTINASMMDNLNALTGKKVILILDGGKVITGKVKLVSAHFVHMEGIERNELFDSLTRIESIQAIEVQFREYQP